MTVSRLAQKYHSRLVFRRCAIRISVGTRAILNEVLREFPQSLQENARIAHQLHHDCFIPDPFQFIIHLSPCHMKLYSVATDSIVKQLTTNRTQALGYQGLGGKHCLLLHVNNATHLNTSLAANIFTLHKPSELQKAPSRC